MEPGNGGSRSDLRRLANDYAAGTITRAVYRQRRRELIEAYTAAPFDENLAATVNLSAERSAFDHVMPGTQPRGSDLTQALSARPLTQFTAVDAQRRESAPASRETRARPQRKDFIGALLSALALVLSAALVGMLLSGMLGN